MKMMVTVSMFRMTVCTPADVCVVHPHVAAPWTASLSGVRTLAGALRCGGRVIMSTTGGPSLSTAKIQTNIRCTTMMASVRRSRWPPLLTGSSCIDKHAVHIMPWRAAVQCCPLIYRACQHRQYIAMHICSDSQACRASLLSAISAMQCNEFDANIDNVCDWRHLCVTDGWTRVHRSTAHLGTPPPIPRVAACPHACRHLQVSSAQHSLRP